MRTERFVVSRIAVLTDTRGRRLLLLVALALILGLLVGTLARAGFVDDWITQHTETSPGYFEGQKRGYFTGGSFSARWPQTKDYLVSVEPPRLQFGCGGIDAFMGGFSFMNFEYLVQKLQRILQAAPAAAFDLALKTLCEPCSNVIKSMNAMSDALNHLQLDDCKAATVIAARAMDPFTDNAKIHAEAQKDFSLERGIQDLGQKLNDIWNANDKKPDQPSSVLTSACPQPIQDIFAAGRHRRCSRTSSRRRATRTATSPLCGASSGMWRSPTSVNDQVRFSFVPPCSENKPGDIYSFYSGNLYVRPVNGSVDGACVLADDTNANLQQWAVNKLVSIYQKMQNQQALSTRGRGLHRHGAPAPRRLAESGHDHQAGDPDDGRPLDAHRPGLCLRDDERPLRGGGPEPLHGPGRDEQRGSVPEGGLQHRRPLGRHRGPGKTGRDNARLHHQRQAGLCQCAPRPHGRPRRGTALRGFSEAIAGHPLPGLLAGPRGKGNEPVCRTA